MDEQQLLKYFPKPVENLNAYLGGVVFKAMSKRGISQTTLSSSLHLAPEEIQSLLDGERDWGEHFQLATLFLEIEQEDIFRKLTPDEIDTLYDEPVRFRLVQYPSGPSLPEDKERDVNLSLYAGLLDYLNGQGVLVRTG